MEGSDGSTGSSGSSSKSRKTFLVLDEPCFSKYNETYSYNDPITELIDCLFVKYDFNAAQDRLNECEKLLASPDLLPINSFPSSSSSVPPVLSHYVDDPLPPSDDVGGAVGDGDFLEEPLTSSLPP
uniref:Uncharacterized protein n=1 Tax=Amphimedon queenslandica TaxID=400682 RepID=A0A1X7U148_AMPQE